MDGPATKADQRIVTVPQGYSFAAATSIAADQRRAVIGGKGAALVRMTELGLAVPPGFTLTTELCNAVLAEGWSTTIDDSIRTELAAIEQTLDRRLGDTTSPLLVSVRSGAPISMPGMMDTVLNAGMTNGVAAALSEQSGNPRFGWDTARRFVQSYARVVGGAPSEQIAELSERYLGPQDGANLDAPALCDAAKELRVAIADAGFPIPEDPFEQICAAALAVFTSWNCERAVTYRRIEGIADHLGTAATVQAMTFGNLGDRSGTGVVFTRDPSTGAPGIVGDFLVGAQGEDVVAGTHATQSISDMGSIWPEIAAELDQTCNVLERDLDDMADIEFTVEEGKIWLLQVRVGKRSPTATLRIAIDMAEDDDFAIDRAGAVDRCAEVLKDPPVQMQQDEDTDGAELLATGLAASPGRAVGQLCTDIDDTLQRSARGESVILIRRETSPADIAGMAEARGMLTTLGGLVSHAAVVARSWGVPAVVGATSIEVRADGIIVSGEFLAAGAVVTVDGDQGRLLRGSHPGSHSELEEVRTLRAWADEVSTSAGLPGSGDDQASSIEVQRLLAMKGMGSAESIAEVLATGVAAVEGVIAGLVSDGKAQELPGGRVRLLPGPVETINELYRTEAVALSPIIEPLMHDFHEVNAAFKELITAWQLRDVDGEQVMNDHADADYDSEIIGALRSDIHARITPIIATVAAAEARFDRYLNRLVDALAAVEGGDAQMMAHPIRDSYHTVWFELHEELIRLSGRNRADEAAAGRG